MEDDLFLVAIDTQHHGSHDRTVFEENTSQDRFEKDSNFCWLPDGSSSEIRVLWKQGNRFVGIPSACPGSLSTLIRPLPFFLGGDMVFVMGEMHNEDSK